MDTKQPPVKVGQRVICVRMEDDPDPVKPGTMGTVARVSRMSVDWVISVNWDDGHGAPLVYPTDRFIIEDSRALDAASPEAIERELESAIVYSLCDARKAAQQQARAVQQQLFTDDPERVSSAR